ncbi:MAG: hypothetical protein MJ183_10460 [Treponemataceae bacterium]|nr:hypothetical protein [Treponemataceae bacterium]
MFFPKIKKFFAFLALFLAVFSCYAESQYIKTEFFDIFYKPEGEKSAIHIANHADVFYRQIAEKLNVDTFMRFPVTIYSDTQECNAYFTAFPYSRIVVYDTVPDSTELAVYSDTLLSIFYHELVHAVTLTINLDKFPLKLGDIFSLEGFLTTLMIKEGATVSFESFEGEGRINDGEAMHYVIQAKAENSFPSPYEASGVRDVYPSAKYAYYMGGAFSDYLQRTYGMEKYAELWHAISDGKIGLFSLLEKTYSIVYGKDLSALWKDFEESIPLQEFADFPGERTLFSDGSYDCISHVPGTDKDFVYASYFDSGVFYAEYLSDDKFRVTKLFAADSGLKELSFSPDGRYLAVIGLEPKAESVYGLKIFDMKTKKFTAAALDSVLDGGFITMKDGSLAVACEGISGYDTALSVYRAEDVLSGEKKPLPLYRENLTRNNEVYDICPAGTDTFAMLHKNEGKWFASLVNIDDGVSQSWQFPEGLKPTALKETPFDGEFTLNLFADGLKAGTEDFPGSVPRLAKLFIKDDTAELVFLKEDISGGFYSPAALEKGYVFAEHRAKVRKVCYMSEPEEKWSKPLKLEQKSFDLSAEPEETEEKLDLSHASFADLSEYRTPTGTFVPIPLYPLSPYTESGITTQPLLGLTYITSDPLMENAFAFGGGFDIFSPSMNANFQYLYEKESFSGFSMASVSWIFPGAFDLSLVSSVAGKKPLFSLNNAFSWENVNRIVYKSGTNRIGIDEVFALSLNFKSSRGSSHWGWDSLSFAVQPWISGVYDINRNNIVLMGDVSLKASASLAKLLPFSTHSGLTFNMPLKVSAALLPEPDTFLDLSSDIVLFGAEIQKSLPLYFYLNRVSLKGGYFADWKESLFPLAVSRLPELFSNMDSMKMKQGFSLETSLTMSSTIGMFANTESQFDLSARLEFYMQNQQNSGKKVSFFLLGELVF